MAHHLGCSSFSRDPSKIVEIQDKIKDSLTQTKENKIENLGVHEGYLIHPLGGPEGANFHLLDLTVVTHI